MELTLTPEEREIVVRLLRNALSDIRVEVRRTETPDFHDRLKGEENLLATVLARLES